MSEMQQNPTPALTATAVSTCHSDRREESRRGQAGILPPADRGAVRPLHEQNDSVPLTLTAVTPALPVYTEGASSSPVRGGGREGGTQATPSFHRFLLIWVGQLVSLVGSSISDFALGIWVYTSSGSVLQFALISLAFVVPKLLISPVAGVLVDRWNRRTVMIVSDTVHTLLMGSVLLILAFGALQSWHLYVITALAAISGSFQWPAYQALIPQLVPPAQLGRANGLIDLAHGLAQLAAPLGGGLLLVWLGLRGIVLIDLLTFGVALVTLLAVRVPDLASRPAPTPSAERSGRATFWQEFLAGWAFIRADRGLLRLMIYIAVTVFLTSFVNVLTPPLVLTFAGEAELGLILTVGGVGLLVGGLVMSVWGGPQPRIYGLLVFDLLPALAMILVGFLTQIPLLAAAAFLFFVGLPISRSSAQSIWQQKVPLHLQGRVFVTRDMLAIGATPLAFLLAGPLADYLFTPLLLADGLLAPTVGGWVGVGPGRGIALFFACLGLALLAINLVAWSLPALRGVEDEGRTG